MLIKFELNMFKRKKVRRSEAFEKRMDRNALIATFGGAAVGVGLGYFFNGAAGAGLGFYAGGLGLGILNQIIVEPLNKLCYDRSYSDTREP